MHLLMHTKRDITSGNSHDLCSYAAHPGLSSCGHSSLGLNVAVFPGTVLVSNQCRNSFIQNDAECSSTPLERVCATSGFRTLSIINQLLNETPNLLGTKSACFDSLLVLDVFG